MKKGKGLVKNYYVTRYCCLRTKVECNKEVRTDVLFL